MHIDDAQQPLQPEWREERGPGCTYRVHRDGRVAAYGRETDSTVPNSWRAQVYDRHPALNPPVDYRDLCGDVSFRELMTYLDEWAKEGPQS